MPLELLISATGSCAGVTTELRSFALVHSRSIIRIVERQCATEPGTKPG